MRKIRKKHLLLGILLLTITMLLTQLVRADPISISITPTGGPVGTSVTVSGVADTPGGTINIYFDIDGDGLTETEELQTSITADPDLLTYEATIIVPASTAGTHAITANDVTAGSSVGAFFIVNPSIAISPKSGPIGTTLTVTGAGFSSNSAVTITTGGLDVTPPIPQTDEFGSFSTSFAIPPALEGLYTITATDEASKTAFDTFTLLGITMSINPVSGPVGTIVAVSGTQATPSGSVIISWDATEIVTVTAAEDGTYSYDLAVSASEVGEHTIAVEDQQSTNTDAATFTVEPKIVLSVEEGPVGTEVTVTGTGFVADAYVDITYDADLEVDNFQTDSTGSFIATFIVPYSVAGIHTITATDTSDLTVTSDATFTVIPAITISAVQGPIGAEVTVTGTGFAGTSSITYTFGSIDVTPFPAPVTDEVGSFSAGFMVPPILADTHTFSTTDEEANTASTDFTVWNVTIIVIPTSGTVGTIVSVSGANATPGGTLTIKWDGTTLGTTTAAIDGTYTYDFAVPASTFGEHTIIMMDDASTNSAADTFTVEPKITLDPEDGLVGGEVTVEGTGFSGSSTVDVYFDKDRDGVLDSEDLVLDDALTDENGSFSTSFNVPWVPTAGNYVTTAIDAEEKTSDATFTVLFVMWSRSTEYFQGDYPSFYIQVVDEKGEPFETQAIVVNVFDATGHIQYRGITFASEDGTVPYDTQFFNLFLWDNYETLQLVPFHLSSDASVGSWNWAATANGLIVNGSFDVIEPVDLRTLLEKLDQLLDGQDDIVGLITYYGEKLQLEHGELAELITAVSSELQLDHDALANLITEVAENLELDHENILALISDVANNVDMKLSDLSTFVGNLATQLQLDYQNIADLISALTEELQLNHTELLNLVNGVAESLQLDHEQITTLIVTVAANLEMRSTELSDFISEVADALHLDHDELYNLINEVATELKLQHESIIALIGEVADNLEMELDDLSALIAGVAADLQMEHSEIAGLISALAEELQLEHEDIGSLISSLAEQLQISGDNLADIISDVAGNLQMEHSDIIELMNNVSEQLEMDHQELADLVSEVFGALGLKLDDIKAETIGIEAKVDGLYVTIGDLAIKLEDVQAQLIDIKNDLATISTTLGVIEAKINDIGAISIEEIKGDIATIKSDIGTIRVNVSNINANITAIKGGIATIETSVGTLQVDIDAISGRLQSLEGTTATIRTDVGTVKVDLTDLNAKITVMNNNEASIQTDIGTIKGRLTTIEDDMATIETDLGTVKTSAQSIETTSGSIKSDTSWQPSTVALSLIAAIAAIAAAVMVLRKVYTK